MNTLKDLQDRFQRGLLAGDDTVLAEIKDSDREDRTVLFGVYRNAYVLRLMEVLGEDYEQLHAITSSCTLMSATPPSPRSPAPISPLIPPTAKARAISAAICRASCARPSPTPSTRSWPRSGLFRRQAAEAGHEVLPPDDDGFGLAKLAGLGRCASYLKGWVDAGMLASCRTA